MPALPAVPKTIKAVVQHTFGEDTDMINRFYFQYTAASWSPADVAGLAAQIATQWHANMHGIMSTECTLASVTCEDLSSATSPVASVFPGTLGTDGGAVIGASSAAVIKFFIPRRYRGGHPRAYIGGLTNARLQDAQTFTAAAAAVIIASWRNFMTAVLGFVPASGGTFAHVNVSYFFGFTVVTNPITGRSRNVPKLRPFGPFTDLVGSYALNPKLGSQRRRNTQSR